MNSYGTDWGDDGFFWLPYDFIMNQVKIDGKVEGTLLSSAYVLLDKKNSDSLPQAPDEQEDLPNNLPNLEIVSWQASYNSNPGGQGVLQYKIVNSGTEIASEVEVSLVLSQNADLNPLYDEYYSVTTESVIIPDGLAPGQAIMRDKDGMLSFKFPKIPSGEYYLHLLVDEHDWEFESNEDDNVSASDKSIALLSDLPDVAINFWFAELDYETKQGKLDYIIVNNGDTPTEEGSKFEINLNLERIDPEPNYDEIAEMPPEELNKLSQLELDELYGVVSLWQQKITETLPPLAGQEPTM